MELRQTLAILCQTHPEIQMLAIWLTAGGFCYYMLPRVKRVSTVKAIHAIPNHRSSHANPISNLGGVAVMAAVLLTTLALNSMYASVRLQYVLASMFLLFLIGLYDDILVISPARKFEGQVVAATLLVLGGNLSVTSFHGLLGIGSIPDWIGIPFAIFAVLGIINAVNLIDGIDGLCSGLAVIALTFFSSWSLANDIFIPWAFLSIAYIGALLPFMRYNLFHRIGARQRVFLGDNGALPLGGLLAGWCLLFCRSYAEGVPGTAQPLQPYTMPPFIALAVLFIPVADTVYVMSMRIARGQSPFHADHTHVHHKWLRLGLSHLQVSLVLWSFQIAIILTTCWLSLRIPPLALFGTLLAWMFIVFRLPVIIANSPWFPKPKGSAV